MTFGGRPSAGSGRRSFRRGRMARVLLAGRRLRRRGRRLDHNLIFLRLLSGRDPETGERWVWRDPGFVSAPLRFGLQAGLATLAMLAILTFVDSLSTAAIAAGLASSVVGIFIAPSNSTARIRSVVGGHGAALVLGSIFSAILFLAPVEIFLQDRSTVLHLSLALAVGGSMLLMAITNTEHPPAAGTALGMASREFDVLIFFSIIGAVGLLAILKLVLRPYLRDLT
ncbi:MAG: HPP family protein [Chloroflexi bacterium]|nr:HPP family protein [Chloroflexota bacterium]